MPVHGRLQLKILRTRLRDPVLYFSFLFYLGFLSRSLTIYRAAWEGVGYFFLNRERVNLPDSGWNKFPYLLMVNVTL